MITKTSGAEIMKSSQPQKAWERLDQAVSRMEAAAKVRLARSDSPDGSGELEAMRERNAALRETSDAVSARLDGAISRLRTILES